MKGSEPTIYMIYARNQAVTIYKYAVPNRLMGKDKNNPNSKANKISMFNLDITNEGVEYIKNYLKHNLNNYDETEFDPELHNIK
jgi:hypothetical protein